MVECANVTASSTLGPNFCNIIPITCNDPCIRAYYNGDVTRKNALDGISCGQISQVEECSLSPSNYYIYSYAAGGILSVAAMIGASYVAYRYCFSNNSSRVERMRERLEEIRDNNLDTRF